MAAEPTPRGGTPEEPDRGARADRDSRAPGDSPDGWDAVELDEAFVRSAETKEPSARARMLAERWRGRAPDPQPWRSDEPPAGWFWSKARRRKWRRK
ncbi:SGM_3592 family protein [Streptomyces sp. JNUCC 64]